MARLEARILPRIRAKADESPGRATGKGAELRAAVEALLNASPS